MKLDKMNLILVCSLSDDADADGSGRLNGALNGALNDNNDPDNTRRDRHADIYYNELRKRKRKPLLERIAKSSGFDINTVTRAFYHLLIEKHNISGGFKRFAPDYDISLSLQRLIEGKRVFKHDKILIGHEARESCLMKAHKEMTYEEAHEIANTEYNYEDALEKWIERGHKDD